MTTVADYTKTCARLAKAVGEVDRLMDLRTEQWADLRAQGVTHRELAEIAERDVIALIKAAKARGLMPETVAP